MGNSISCSAPEGVISPEKRISSSVPSSDQGPVRELYVTWSKFEEVSKEEVKTAIVDHFGDIVQTIMFQNGKGKAIDGVVLMRPGYDAKAVLNGAAAVEVRVNGKVLIVKERKKRN